MDIEGANTNNGTDVIAWNKHSSSNQQWRMQGDKIISVLNGKCLDINEGSKESCARIIMWPLKSPYSVDNQSWEFVYQ